jgi:hypothetical protein
MLGAWRRSDRISGRWHAWMRLPKGGAVRRLRQVRAAQRAPALQPPVALHKRFGLGKIDLMMFPDHRTCFTFRKRQAVMPTMRRAVIFIDMRRFGETAGMALMAGPGSTSA